MELSFSRKTLLDTFSSGVNVLKLKMLPIRTHCGVPMPIDYPSMKASELKRILIRSLGYAETRRTGSHRRMESDNHPPLTFAFHDNQSIPPGLLKKILHKDIGLSDKEIRDILRQK
jgi:predicted RNA binding protein YcfA (HicA-like mRNA interferase family)